MGPGENSGRCDLRTYCSYLFLVLLWLIREGPFLPCFPTGIAVCDFPVRSAFFLDFSVSAFFLVRAIFSALVLTGIANLFLGDLIGESYVTTQNGWLHKIESALPNRSPGFKKKSNFLYKGKLPGVGWLSWTYRWE